MEGVDREARQVIVAPLIDEDGSELIGRHTIRYDYLVLAIGSVTNDFGIKGVKENCLFLDDRSQADRFRNKLLNHCLRVSRAMSEEGLSDQYVRVAIVGAGATGVELAAELYNAAKALRHYGLEVFDETRLEVTIIEAGPRILPLLPEALADAAREQLEALGVKVLEGRRVVEVTADAVITAQGDRIQAEIKVWAAGVRGPDILKNIDGLERTPTNQLLVRPTLQTTMDDRIFALGDCCSCLDPHSGRPIPPRAQAAHQMASVTYDNLLRSMDGRELVPMVYRDHGSLVSLSRFSTVGSLMGALVGGRMAVYGALARLVYESLYRMHLIAIHGSLRGVLLILVGHVNAIVRPKLKFH
jgi:NADH dehydrogenase